MDEAKAFSLRTFSFSALRERVLIYSILAYMVLVLLAFVAIPILALNWFQSPFPGVLVEPAMLVSEQENYSKALWGPSEYHLSAGDQIISVNSEPVADAAQFIKRIGAYEIGDTVILGARSADGADYELSVTLSTFPYLDRFAYLWLPYFMGLAYLLISLWVFAMRKEYPAGKAFAVVGSSMALVMAGWFDVVTTHQLTPIWIIALGMVGGGIFNLMIVFPRSQWFGKQLKSISGLGYFIGVGLASFAVLAFLNHNAAAYLQNWQWLFIFNSAMLGGFILRILTLWRTSPSPIERQQTRLVGWSFLIGFFPVFVYSLLKLLGITWFANLPITLWLLPALTIFPVLAMSIMRFRLARTDYYLSRSISYALLAVMAGVGYSLIVAGVSVLLSGIVRTDHPFFIGMLVFLLALLFNPLRTWSVKAINTIFFRGEVVSEVKTAEFRSQLTQAVELADIITVLRQYIERDLFPVRLHIFVHSQMTDLYEATVDETRRPTTDIRFARGSGLAELLSTGKEPALYLGELEKLPEELESDRSRLALLGADLLVPLQGQQRMAGWVALGARRGGGIYGHEDLSYLSRLCEQAALAIERAQVMADKDRRVLEMNVLTLVAQGVNVTIEFDDILELIYAQTRQVMPADDFAITLYTEATDSWRHVFMVEEDDRLEEIEGQLIPPGQGLERLVLQSRRHIRSDDYDRECRTRRVLPAKQGLFAWMGVPLNAGAETIGVVSVGSRDSVVLYTDEQHGILQAVADQAAGAIVKARLLGESEGRAKQLATLNEVAQNLSSTLDIEPLLEQILDSAVELLNCEAGSLLTLDEESNELVFSVVNGPVKDELTGTRMPADEGLVGKAVIERVPIVVNNVGRSEDWSESTDKTSGFETRGLLGVPMVMKDKVLGVLEVLNKKNGMPFNENDQELLIAFTGQAAVAIENARLYTQTDQKLTERVEELSVMQRIDRELNASLDVTRAMRITLEWAMRQSKAQAGLIGLVSPDGLQVIASEGYFTELAVYGDPSILPLSNPIFGEVLAQEREIMLTDADLTSEGTFLRGAMSQLGLPIHREDEVAGVLLLESQEAYAYAEEMVDFLARLADHAAIAIANAQLYDEVQRANIAKSEFVSFVAHELKTPMTSIRGYSDLLLAGAVGEVTDAQNDFLMTIKTNIGRMATLVSDLADVSRIEAGNLHMEFAPVKMSSIVDEVIRSTQALFDKKEQTLVIDVPEDLPPVWGDRNRIIQVMTNLTSNAHKYTLEKGVVTIRAVHAPNTWDPEGAPEVIHLQVIDTGIGIKEEDQKKIFTQYFRTEEGQSTAPGTGLGLNIARNLVEMQGGKIWFESEFEKGTTFQFTVPIADTEMVE